MQISLSWRLVTDFQLFLKALTIWIFACPSVTVWQLNSFRLTKHVSILKIVTVIRQKRTKLAVLQKGEISARDSEASIWLAACFYPLSHQPQNALHEPTHDQTWLQDKEMKVPECKYTAVIHSVENIDQTYNFLIAFQVNDKMTQ